MVSAEVVPSAKDFASAAAPKSVPHWNSPAPIISVRANQESSDRPPAQTATVFDSRNSSAVPFLAANKSHAPFKAVAAIANWQRVISANPIQFMAGEAVAD